jgi:hypothetical protein
VYDRCTKSAIGTTELCVAHGGGTRCLTEGCGKSAQPGGIQHCQAHGGGKRCQTEGCTTAALSGGSQHCWPHGGGIFCDVAECEGDGFKVQYGPFAGKLRCTRHGGAAPRPKLCEHAAGCRFQAKCVPASVCVRELSFGGSINASA